MRLLVLPKRVNLAPAAAVALVSILATSSGALAQTAATGTLTGHVTFCRPVPRTLAEGDPPPGGVISNLADVTPGLNRGIRQAALRIPAADLLLTIQGTSLTARTDASGAFTLTGVPSGQALTVLAMVQTGPALVVSGPNVMLSPGQTFDLGTLSTAGCPDGNAPFILQPAATDQTTGADSATAQAPDTATATDATATDVSANTDTQAATDTGSADAGSGG